MSVQLIAWAYAQKVGSPTEKAVLLAIANRANHDTGQCHPSLRRVAEETEFGYATVKRAVGLLEEKGFLKRERRRRPDGSLSGYSYYFPEPALGLPGPALSPSPGVSPSPSPGPALSPLEPEVNLEPEEDLEPDPSVVSPNGWTVDKRRVTEPEQRLATAVLAVWNDHAGTSLRSKDWLAKIVMRIREHPDLTVVDHSRIIASSLANPWWRGPPTPSVVYGSGAQFERQMLEADEAGKRNERFEGMKELIRKAQAR